MAYTIVDVGNSNRPSTLPIGVWNQLESKARRYLLTFPGDLDQWHRETERIIEGLKAQSPAECFVVVNEWANHHAIDCWTYQRLAVEFDLWPHVEFAENVPWAENPLTWDAVAERHVPLRDRQPAFMLPPDPWFGKRESRAARIDL